MYSRLNRASLKDSSFQNFRKRLSYNERILTLTKILKYEHLRAVLDTGKSLLLNLLLKSFLLYIRVLLVL